MDPKTKFDLSLLLIYPILSCLFSFVFEVNVFVSILLFFGLPAAHLTFRGLQFSKKALVFSAVTGIPLIIVVDYIAHITGQWIIPNTVFSFRIFDVVTFEIIIWTVLNIYCVIMFYDVFLHHHVTHRLFHPHMKYAIILIVMIFVVFLGVLYSNPLLLGKIPYFYLVFGTLLWLIPIVLEIVFKKKFLSKFIKTAAYFFFLSFLYEITALKRGWWNFPGDQFIGHITVLDVSFPLEELIFWMMLFSMAVLTWYEYFDEGNR